jgi:hypothetical protein
MPKGGRRLTSWKKGQSGNRSGRPKRPETIEARKVIADVKEAAREMTPKALATLDAAMDATSAPWAAKVTAAMGVLAYGWGRPKETIEATHHMRLEELVLGSMRPKRALEQIDNVSVVESEPSVRLIGKLP